MYLYWLEYCDILVKIHVSLQVCIIQTYRAYERNSGARGKFLFQGPYFPKNVGERWGGGGVKIFFPALKIDQKIFPDKHQLN